MHVQKDIYELVITSLATIGIRCFEPCGESVEGYARATPILGTNYYPLVTSLYK
jgi:hypothetical protein